MSKGSGKLAAGAVLLVLALAFLWVENTARWRDMERLRASQSAEAPAVDPRSSTGYAGGEHRIILLRYSMDGYQYLLQAERVLAGRDWRVHFVDTDNAPYGREAHWSSAVVWWLAGLAWIDRMFTGLPLPLALEQIAPIATPILLTVVLVFLLPLVTWRFGIAAAAVVGAGFLVFNPFSTVFVAGYIDHQSMTAIVGLLSVLLLVAGGGSWLRDGDDWLPERSEARWWFAGAAVAGAVGMWLNAASQVPVLIGIGLGALAFPRGPARRDPTLWRYWGAVGAAASLFFYLLEHLPALYSPRMEVNHPLYALAWLGGGDLLCRITSPRSKDWRRALLHALPALLAVAAAPLTVLIAREHVFMLAEPFLWAAHTQYVEQNHSFLRRLAYTSWPALLLGLSWPLAALLGSIALLYDRQVTRPWKGLLVLASVPFLLFFLMTLKQERWLLLACAFSLSALVTVVVAAQKCLRWNRPRALVGGAALAALVLLQPLQWGVYASDVHPELKSQSYHMILGRSMAHALRQRLGDERGVVVGGPSLTALMIFFGGTRGLGTSYWENRDGEMAGVEILGAATDEEALAGIRRRGVTHIVDASWDFFATPASTLLRGEGASPGFLERLEKGEIPPWLKPVIRIEGYRNAMVYEVIPATSDSNGNSRPASE